MLKVKLEEGAKAPTRAHDTDAGLDLYAAEDAWIPANGFKAISTGTCVQIPEGHVGLLTSKSGMMCSGLTCRGTIDCGYTGIIKAIVFNHSDMPFHIIRGNKVTQLVILPCVLDGVEVVDSLEETERGANGFGSTGEA